MGAPNPYQRLYDRVKSALRREVDGGTSVAGIYRRYTLRRRLANTSIGDDASILQSSV